MKNFNEDNVTYNRIRWKDGWKHPFGINRWIYAYTSASMREVSKWKVDVGGSEIQSLEELMKYALTKVIEFNAATFFTNMSAERLEQITGVVFAKYGHMSLYAVIDAMECLMSNEDPCAGIKTEFGFDNTAAVMQALSLYWRKCQDEYFAAEKTAKGPAYQDIPKGAPMPAGLKELQQKLEEKFKSETKADAIEKTRAALEWYAQNSEKPL